MAKTSMKVKQQRPQKYKVREYTRCERCGRPHSVIKKFKLHIPAPQTTLIPHLHTQAAALPSGFSLHSFRNW